MESDDDNFNLRIANAWLERYGASIRPNEFASYSLRFYGVVTNYWEHNIRGLTSACRYAAIKMQDPYRTLPSFTKETHS